MRATCLSSLLLFLVLTLFGIQGSSQAQPTIRRFAIAGGGGSSQGGTTRITGTVGLPDAGQLSAGAVQISGGFWPGSVGAPTPTPSPTPTQTTTVSGPTPTPTSSPTPTASPTEGGTIPTPTPTEFDFDIGGGTPDGFIDSADLLELISQLRALGIDPQILFKFFLYWQGQYPHPVKGLDYLK